MFFLVVGAYCNIEFRILCCTCYNQAEIVEIIAIGKGGENEAYKDAVKRLKTHL